MDEQTETLDINLDLLSKEDLIKFINYAHLNDYTFNQAVVEALKSQLIKLEQIESENESQIPSTDV